MKVVKSQTIMDTIQLKKMTIISHTAVIVAKKMSQTINKKII